MLSSEKLRVFGCLAIVAASALVAFVGVTPQERAGHRRAITLPKIRSDRSVDFVRILRQNETICALLVLGVFTGGLTTAGVLAGVAFTTTASVIQVQHLTGAGAQAMLAFLAPHGFIEVGAFVAAGTAGFGGIPLLLALCGGDRRVAYQHMCRSLRLGLGAAFLLAVAALIEAFVTPMVLGRVL